MLKRHILVVDDEPDIRGLVREILEDEGFTVSVAQNAAEARALIRSFKPDMALLDIWMPDVDGISLLKEWQEADNLSMPVVMMSGHGNVETAVEATRYGAYDFIEKPLSTAKLLLTVKQALANGAPQQAERPTPDTALARLAPVGKSRVMVDLRARITRLARHDTPVLIKGESGADKLRYARYLHALGGRRAGPFIAVSVAALGREQAAAALFGPESNTASNARRPTGYFEQAQGGTLFIEDVGELDDRLQAALQAVLESKTFTRGGGAERRPADMRLVAATRFDLEERLRESGFRDDLYYRLNILPLTVPALREHYEDIPALLDYYVNYFTETEGLPCRRFNIAAQNRLRGYHWPGNERELKNLVQGLLLLGREAIIGVTEVEAALGRSGDKHGGFLAKSPAFDLPLREARENFERTYLEYQLARANGSVSRAASAVGIERTHLYRKLKMLGIELK